MEIVTDRELLDYSGHCVRACARELGRAEEGLPPPFVVFTGGRVAEFRKQPGHGTAVILKGGSDRWQLRYQAGHEISHWLCTPAEAFPGIFHWTHEMLAFELALRCLRGSKIEGSGEYAGRCEQLLERQARRTSRKRMLTTPLTHPYSWVYGRAFVTGRQLQDAVGWERVKELATCFDKRGQPDLRGWLGILPTDERKQAELVLGRPSSDWV